MYVCINVCMYLTYVCMYSCSVDPLYLGCTSTIALVCLVVSISSVCLSVHLTTIKLPFLYMPCSPFFCFSLFTAGGICFMDDMTVPVTVVLSSGVLLPILDWNKIDPDRGRIPSWPADHQSKHHTCLVVESRSCQ